MITKITYDLNNKEDVDMINDYYFLKYYINSIYFDWINTLRVTDEINEDIIIKHLNKTEFERLVKILEKYFFIPKKWDFTIEDILYDIIAFDRYEYIDFMKYSILLKLGTKKQAKQFKSKNKLTLFDA
jgi:hypothetical protein